MHINNNYTLVPTDIYMYMWVVLFAHLSGDILKCRLGLHGTEFQPQPSWQELWSHGPTVLHNFTLTRKILALVVHNVDTNIMKTKSRLTAFKYVKFFLHLSLSEIGQNSIVLAGQKNN